MDATVLCPTSVMVAIAAIAVVVLVDMMATVAIEIAHVLATTPAISASVAISKATFIVVIDLLLFVCSIRRPGPKSLFY